MYPHLYCSTYWRGCVHALKLNPNLSSPPPCKRAKEKRKIRVEF